MGLFFLLLLSQLSVLQAQSLKFEHLNIKDGLSQSTVLNINQDGDGFIWVATTDGLNRYDGYAFKQYKHSTSDTTSLPDNYVFSLVVDSEQKLWVCSKNGLALYQPKTDNFKTYRFDKEKVTAIRHALEDSKKRFWIGTSRGLVLFDKKTGRFKKWVHNPKDENSLSNDRINALTEDKHGNIWITTDEGLNKYNPKTDTFKRYYHDSENENSLSSNLTFSILCSSTGQIIVSTRHDGLNIYDEKTDNFQHIFYQADDQNSLASNSIIHIAEYENKIWVGTENGLNIIDLKHYRIELHQHDPSRPSSLSRNSCQHTFRDNNHNYWIGTFKGGINVYKPQKNVFQHFRTSGVEESQSISHNAISSFLELDDGRILIGTDGGGLNLYDSQTRLFEHFKHDPNDPTTIGSNAVIKLKKDSKGRVWVGTWAGGLNLFDVEKGTFKRFLHDEQNPLSLMDNNIWEILEDSKGRFWVGGHFGLQQFDPEKGIVTRPYQASQHKDSLQDQQISALYEDKKGQIWVGTQYGLHRYHENTDSFTGYIHHEQDTNSISHNLVMSITEDSNGKIWVGTLGGGLNLFDSETNKFHKQEDIDNGAVHGVLEEQKGVLWISTNGGIYRFDYQNNTSKLYYAADGLQSNEFSRGAYLKLHSGEMLFGGTNGFNIFKPNKLASNKNTPNIVFTDLKLLMESVKISPDGILKESINHTKTLELNYNHTSLTFEFSALDFENPNSNQYAYKLEGLDTAWNYVGSNRRFAIYTSLAPKTYILKVKGSNNDGVWNETPRTIKIVVHPPFWETLGFRSLIILFLAIGIYLFYRFRTAQIQEQKDELERQVQNRTEELVQQQEAMRQQSEIVEKASVQIREKNKYITAGINYAGRIQQAILPLEENMRQDLPEYFIFYRPKDIVSGDFYWYKKIKNEILIASVDCTGHGVPGAFMSMIGSALLDRVTSDENITKPHQALEALHLGIRKALKQKESSNRDGMDMSLCAINKTKKILEFAGAKSPLVYVRNNQLQIIKGDRSSIGGHQREDERRFATYQISLEEPLIFYLYSDGYQDQFGGNERKKFKSKPFRDLLLEIHQKSMDEQNAILAETIENWRLAGAEKQNDDILVIGVKIEV